MHIEQMTEVNANAIFTHEMVGSTPTAINQRKVDSEHQ
jgi:hypothetical protein